MELLTLALAMFYVRSLIGALPWPPGWLSRKPLSCSTCLMGWQAIAVTGWWVWRDAPVLCGLGFLDEVTRTALPFGAAGLALVLDLAVERLRVTGWGLPPG